MPGGWARKDDRGRGGRGQSGRGESRPSPGEWLRERLSDAGRSFKCSRREDVNSIAGLELPKHRLAARLGLLTVSRLLADCEPFRLRWASDTGLIRS